MKSIKSLMSVVFVATIVVSTSAFAKPTLWGENISPFVRKVKVVLAEKNIDYKHIEVLPISVLKATDKKVPETFAKISPLGKVPALENDGIGIADSSVIAQYLEAKYPKSPKLYPKNPEVLAKALWFENYADNVIGVAMKHIFLESFVKPKLLNVSGDETLLKQGLEVELPAVLNYLESELGNSKWLAGDEFSIADIAVTTHFVTLKQAGVEVDAKVYPKTAKYLKKVMNRESFKSNWF